MSIKAVGKKSTGNWWVYVVICSDRTLYTGCTTDVNRRVMQHNGDLRGGAKYTASRRPVVLIAMEPAFDRSAAQKRESEIKKLSKIKKIEWCRSHSCEVHEENH